MNIVLVWAWWTWISGVALILKQLWYQNIVCIDNQESQITKLLKKNDIKTIIWHWNYQVKPEDIVIYSDAAINSPEVIQSNKLKEKKLKKYHTNFSYFQFVWELSKYMKTISIAWTHWKSTTTALCINTISKVSDKFWMGILGALVGEFDNKNFLINKNRQPEIWEIFNHIISRKKSNLKPQNIKKLYMIVEADEFNQHFLYLDTDYSAITNIELDHSDVYKNLETYIKSFSDFVKKTRFKCIWLRNIKELKQLKQKHPEKILLKNHTNIPLDYIFGDHNRQNSIIVYNILKHIFPSQASNIKQNISKFKWLWRRCELIWENKNQSLIFSDYWHHPTEINAVLDALKKKYPNKKINCIFQPHQARRVFEFFNKFLKSLKKVDNLIIYDIYTAREDIKRLSDKHQKFNWIDNKQKLWSFFAKKLNSNYTENFEKVYVNIFSLPKDRITIIFTAWDLDFKLRNSMKD